MKGNRSLLNFGWNKQTLLRILAKNGIFDYQEKQYGDYFVYDLPKFESLGLSLRYGPNPEPADKRHEREKNGLQPIYNSKIYPIFINHLPKMFLEVLYRKFLAKDPDLARICRSNVSTASSIRYMAKRLLNIDIAGDKDQVCAALKGISLMKAEVGKEISEIAPELIMQPGGVQYLKYRPQGQVSYEVPKSRQIELRVWQNEVDDICKSEDNDSTQAYNYAEKIGLGSYIKPGMPKENICKILYNYIKILSEGRSL
jgi:hypothetical protein